MLKQVQFEKEKKLKIFWGPALSRTLCSRTVGTSPGPALRIVDHLPKWIQSYWVQQSLLVRKGPGMHYKRNIL